MPGPTVITSDRAAEELAGLLNGTHRRRPVVVVTIPAGRHEPLIDAHRIHDEVGDLAEVYLITTGPHTWAFSRLMPGQTQVYGGAGRVYPVGHEWVGHPRVSPLRFAFDAAEGSRATEALVSDALRMAGTAGLPAAPPSLTRRRVTGVVTGFLTPERALVSHEGGQATVCEELTVPGVPLQRVLRKSMSVTGWVDVDVSRLDIGESLRAPERSLAAYEVGAVVLTRVDRVETASARLLLHPSVGVRLARSEVTSNELDDLRSLMTPDDVVRARVLRGPPHWRLTLLDIDDDESPEPAPALITGGPPWLVEPEPEPIVADRTDPESPAAPVLLRSLPSPPPCAPPGASRAAGAAPGPRGAAAVGAPRTPSPAILDPRRRQHRQLQPAAAPPAAGAAASLARTVDGLRAGLNAVRAELAGAQAELARLRATVDELEVERAFLAGESRRREREIARRDDELRRAKSALLKARTQRRGGTEHCSPLFADREQGFRYAVLTAWASRTPPAEQPARPLPEYVVGPDFLDSLESLDGLAPDKVAHVVFEVVTGRARELPGRDLHRLRESEAGGSAYVRRPADGAICWRASLQVNTPQARRLHYWELPGGTVELSRVGLHDERRP